ncbi:hypothetical protein IM40_06125 [Candidatus Paracaedimonas acanthamoebae]|nr:hypothetical protein IM40_06125 [Candidatus Paracaedimonas acanthamoebae]
MKAFKFLALSAVAVSTTSVYAKEKFSENAEARPLRSRAAEKDLLVLSGLNTAKGVMKTKQILEDIYKKLAKDQRKQRIAARKAALKKARMEQKEKLAIEAKLNAISKLPAVVDTLNVPTAMKLLFMYPQVQNPDLEEAIVNKTNALMRRRKDSVAIDRKAEYINKLDVYFAEVEQDSKYWALGNDGYRHVVKSVSRPHVEKIFSENSFSKPKTRLFAKRMKVWEKKEKAAAAA